MSYDRIRCLQTFLPSIEKKKDEIYLHQVFMALPTIYMYLN